MTRYATNQKAETHAKIINAAGKLFRKNGFHMSGVDRVMKEVGLTSGGFYAHFKSKDALLVETVQDILSESREKVYFDGIEHLDSMEWITEVVNRLISEKHNLNYEGGCPLTALVGDIGRGSDEVKALFGEESKRSMTLLMKKMPGKDDKEKKKNAVFFMVVLIGAINIARALPSEEAASATLKIAREQYLQLLKQKENV